MPSCAFSSVLSQFSKKQVYSLLYVITSYLHSTLKFILQLKMMIFFKTQKGCNVSSTFTWLPLWRPFGHIVVHFIKEWWPWPVSAQVLMGLFLGKQSMAEQNAARNAECSSDFSQSRCSFWCNVAMLHIPQAFCKLNSNLPSMLPRFIPIYIKTVFAMSYGKEQSGLTIISWEKILDQMPISADVLQYYLQAFIQEELLPKHLPIIVSHIHSSVNGSLSFPDLQITLKSSNVQCSTLFVFFQIIPVNPWTDILGSDHHSL